MPRSCGRAAQRFRREHGALRLSFLPFHAVMPAGAEKAKKGGRQLPPSFFDKAAGDPAALRRACGKMSQACTASYSRCSESISSLTEMISFTRETLAPQKAKPRSRLPFMALMRAEAMQ